MTYRMLLVSLALLLTLGLVACGGDKPAPSGEVPAASDDLPPIPPGHPPVDGAAPTERPAAEVSWNAPEGWQEVPPASSMRWTQWQVAGDAGQGECVVFFFGPGQGGDAQSNADRWAGQFEDNDARAYTTEQKTVGDIQLLLVDVKGSFLEAATMAPGASDTTHSDWGLLGAIAELPNGNRWFFKFTGPAATIDANREGFMNMMDSLSLAPATPEGGEESNA